jgi:hypothetical protein
MSIVAADGSSRVRACPALARVYNPPLIIIKGLVIVMAKALRIGFVDYKLENFHANVFLQLIRETLKDRGATVVGCNAMDEQEGKAWATKNNVRYFAEPARLNEAVDAFMILAPSNPEAHFELCKKIFPFSKPTYVDKTFAPDLATAKKIFALADKHKTKIQTASALRYTNVQEGADKSKLRSVIAWGGGTSFDEYIIHPVEMIVSLLGPEVKQILRLEDGERNQLILKFSGGRTAIANVFPNTATDFAAALTTDKETKYIRVDNSKLFSNTAAAILDFLSSGKPNIDRAESLAVRRIIDAAESRDARKGFVRV